MIRFPRRPVLACATLALAAMGATTLPRTAAAAAPAAPDLSARITQAANRLATIDAQANRVADYDELRNLQQILGYYFDKSLWNQVADLFAENGTLEVAGNGEYVGRENIRRYLLGLTQGREGPVHGELNNHFQLSPVITLSEDGKSARARWRLMALVGDFGKSADWGAGVYENEYVKEGGVWKFQRLHLHLKFFAPYEGGWTRTTAQLNARYGKSTARPTRRSNGASTWPEARPVAMHFENPARSNYRLAPPKPVSAPAKADRTVAELEAQARALELKLSRLKAVEEVERLENIYGYYADKSMQDAISALFAENSTLEILGRGVFIGRDRVYEYMRRLGVPTHGTLFNHMQLQPVVHVSEDGNSASVRARLFVMFGRADAAAQWGDGVYENRFVKENGFWKYQSLEGFQTFYANYAEGWGKHAVPMMSYFPGYPPDMPTSDDYQPYPAPFVPPFHYANPVTGK